MGKHLALLLLKGDQTVSQFHFNLHLLGIGCSTDEKVKVVLSFGGLTFLANIIHSDTTIMNLSICSR